MLWTKFNTYQYLLWGSIGPSVALQFIQLKFPLNLATLGLSAPAANTLTCNPHRTSHTLSQSYKSRTSHIHFLLPESNWINQTVGLFPPLHILRVEIVMIMRIRFGRELGDWTRKCFLCWGGVCRCLGHICTPCSGRGFPNSWPFAECFLTNYTHNIIRAKPKIKKNPKTI